MSVIRGTDFEAVRSGSLAGVPSRFIAAKNADRKALRPNDILIETAGGSKGRPTGKTVLLRQELFDRAVHPLTCASFARFLRVNPCQANPEYVYWYLQHLYKSGVIESHQVQHTGIARFQFTKFADSTDVPLPPLRVQCDLVGVMAALDNRIALLRDTNATLEAIAQALFKSWFVDFDPVRAKQQGLAPAGMDEATAALFPDSFEESALGSVPKGWRASPVYDMATYINGAAYKAFEPNTARQGRPIIKIAELKSGVTAQTAFSAVAMHEKYLIETGDILFSWSGNPDTSIDTFVWTHESAWLNQHIFRVLPRSRQERAFVLQLLKQLRPVFAELARNKQTTGLGHVTVADMKRLLVVEPDAEVVKEFDRVAGAIQSRIFANERQAQTLATLRDTLLPRLISGQLRLPEAEALAA